MSGSFRGVRLGAGRAREIVSEHRRAIETTIDRYRFPEMDDAWRAIAGGNFGVP
jgi:hypothetical protein